MIDAIQIWDLLSKVPMPPEELPEGINDHECDVFEKRTGIRLPADLRDWLKLCNGPCAGPGGFFGIRPWRSDLDIEAILELYPEWEAKKWIPVAGDGCGNYYVMPTEQEFGPGFPVFFIEAEESRELPQYIAASDLGHFLIAILQRELNIKGWPFDRDFVMQSDPEITRFHSVKLPWLA